MARPGPKPQDPRALAMRGSRKGRDVALGKSPPRGLGKAGREEWLSLKSKGQWTPAGLAVIRRAAFSFQAYCDTQDQNEERRHYADYLKCVEELGFEILNEDGKVITCLDDWDTVDEF